MHSFSGNDLNYTARTLGCQINGKLLNNNSVNTQGIFVSQVIESKRLMNRAEVVTVEPQYN